MRQVGNNGFLNAQILKNRSLAKLPFKQQEFIAEVDRQQALTRINGISRENWNADIINYVTPPPKRKESCIFINDQPQKPYSIIAPANGRVYFADLNKDGLVIPARGREQEQAEAQQAVDILLQKITHPEPGSKIECQSSAGFDTVCNYRDSYEYNRSRR